ncbi:MAG: DUF4105 domain-containing protein [Bacteroidales bacterium]|nr:DUF4105 domain-containing protein [Bacteroidales bacterium]
MRIKLTIALLIAWFQAVGAINSADLKVSFVNFYPGEDIYELEGHSVIRLQTPQSDMAVSYGMFDFNSPGFVYRFVKGETDYWVAAVPWDRFAELYRRQGRTIVEHPILLDSLQKVRLLEVLDRNLMPQNRVYRYNYVKDNCALRPLRAIQEAVGDSIMLPAPEGEAAQAKTFREVMRLYHKNYPWYQFGIDLALGSGIDYPISDAEKAFAPIVLDSQLPKAIANGKNLTAEPIVVFQGHDATLGPTPWHLSPMAVSLAILALSILFTVRDIRRLRVTRWFDAVLYALFGLAGCLLAFLIFVSVHEATSPNWLFLWLNPLALCVPLFIWLKKCNIIVFWYQILNFALLIAMVALWPMLGQSANPAFWPLVACDALRAANYIYVTIRQRQISR